MTAPILVTMPCCVGVSKVATTLALAAPRTISYSRRAQAVLTNESNSTGVSTTSRATGHGHRVQRVVTHATFNAAWASANSSIEEAETLPSFWYTDPDALALEDKAVFQNTWQAVGHVSQLLTPGSYVCGNFLGVSYILCRDSQGAVRAFHNVCRHHAASVASGAGCTSQFECRYHGWMYGLDGRLCRAPHMKGTKDFKASDYGLVPIRCEVWGPFIWLDLGVTPAARQQAASSTALGADPQGLAPVADWLGEGGRAVLGQLDAGGLQWVSSREYLLQCNWKVFCDNYLDGGYHVPVAHPELAADLDLTSYRSLLYERVSVQTCRTQQQQSRGGGGRQADRLGGGRDAMYAFVYPNFMINRYGPWLDTNWVVPLSADSCRVVFHWFLEAELCGDSSFVSSSLAASETVQQQDVSLCEDVQRGLRSRAYVSGRYVAPLEAPMFHFHRLLHRQVGAARGVAGSE